MLANECFIVLVEDIKANLKLINNTHISEPNILEKPFSVFNTEFQKWISQSQFSYHPLRTEKGFSKTFSLKMWVLLISFKLSLIHWSVQNVLIQFLHPIYHLHNLNLSNSRPNWNKINATRITDFTPLFWREEWSKIMQLALLILNHFFPTKVNFSSHIWQYDLQKHALKIHVNCFNTHIASLPSTRLLNPISLSHFQ